MTRARTWLAVGGAIALVSVGMFAWWSSGSPVHTAQQRDAAREHLRARVTPMSLPNRSQAPALDWDDLEASFSEDLEGLLHAHGPRPDWPEHAVRSFHAELMARGMLANDVRRFYPRFVCETRCSSANQGAHSACLEQCGLALLTQPGGDHLAGWVMGLAADRGNAELYREVATAYPATWADLQTGLATSGGPRASLTVLWGQTVRRTAPGLQASLYTFGKQQQGMVGRVAVAASGRTACVWVGGQAVCP